MCYLQVINDLLEEDLMNDSEKLVKEIKKGPDWLNITEDGKKHVDQIKLAKYLEKKYRFNINQFSQHGYWYDPKVEQWKGHADDIIEASIKDEIVPYGIWKVNLITSIAKLITLDSKRIVDSDPFDEPAVHKAVFGKHTYNLETDRLEPNSPDNYLLQNRSYELDINGKADTWNEWLRQSLVPCTIAKYDDNNDKEHSRLTDEYDLTAVETVKAFIGYALAGSHKDFQHYMILYGNGGEGKSTFLGKITEVIGKFNVSDVSLDDLSDQEAAKFTTSKLYHKAANIFADISPKFMKQTNIIKVLTGGDTITAQFKHKDPFEFRNEAKMIFSANELPAFKDFTDGFKRRPIIVTFHPIKNFNKKFNDEGFKREIPAFAYECLLAYRKALEANKFPQTEFMRQQKQDWIDANDNIGNWIKDCCSIADGDRGKGTCLYESYKTYCIATGSNVMSKKNFNNQLMGRGYEYGSVKINGKTVKGFKGIKVK